MDLLIPLWLPILLSAVVVWIVSAVVWMALPHHKRDFIALADEDGFMDHLRKSGIQPGNYAWNGSRYVGGEFGNLQNTSNLAVAVFNKSARRAYNAGLKPHTAAKP